MRTGDIVRARGINVVFESAVSRGTAGVKAPKGRRLVFLVLGTDSIENELDPKDVLATLGYVPDPSISAASANASGAGERHAS